MYFSNFQHTYILFKINFTLFLIEKVRSILIFSLERVTEDILKARQLFCTKRINFIQQTIIIKLLLFNGCLTLSVNTYETKQRNFELQRARLVWWLGNRFRCRRSRVQIPEIIFHKKNFKASQSGKPQVANTISYVFRGFETTQKM